VKQSDRDRWALSSTFRPSFFLRIIFLFPPLLLFSVRLGCLEADKKLTVAPAMQFLRLFLVLPFFFFSPLFSLSSLWWSILSMGFMRRQAKEQK